MLRGKNTLNISKQAQVLLDLLTHHFSYSSLRMYIKTSVQQQIIQLFCCATWHNQNLCSG